MDLQDEPYMYPFKVRYHLFFSSQICLLFSVAGLKIKVDKVAALGIEFVGNSKFSVASFYNFIF